MFPTSLELLDDPATNGARALTDRPLPLSQQAYEHIRRKIISTELAPGSIIDEVTLQADLDMGRTPIREALQRLSLEKLVTILPRRGMFVTEIGITDLQRLFEIRYELEGMAARLAAQRGTPAQFDRMEAILRHLPPSAADAELLIAIDEASHHLIYEAANKFLRDTLTTLYAQSLRLWYFTLSKIGTLQETVAEHQLILDALKARDGDEASRLIRDHVQTFHQKKQAAMLGVDG
jgi:DNA-binding GntR family transcriptional regulator